MCASISSKLQVATCFATLIQLLARQLPGCSEEVGVKVCIRRKRTWSGNGGSPRFLNDDETQGVTKVRSCCEEEARGKAQR